MRPPPSTPTAITSLSSSQVQARAPAAFITNSPVTRSHCRYHRISIPKTENGPRIFFLVPGCTLGNKEFMEEEEIEDHGDATYEDSLRVVRNIELLDFEDYLISVLRQLVGPHLLREAEIYYLRAPGEEEAPWKPRLPRALFERAKQNEGTVHGSPASNRPPHSAAGSTSTTVSALRRMIDPEVVSDSEYDLTEDGTDMTSSPRTKRIKSSHTQNKGETSLSQASIHSNRTKRGKRLAPDAFAYKPSVSDEESGVDEDAAESRPHRKSKRGTKRGRAAENGGQEEEKIPRKNKKLKIDNLELPTATESAVAAAPSERD